MTEAATLTVFVPVYMSGGYPIVNRADSDGLYQGEWGDNDDLEAQSSCSYSQHYKIAADRLLSRMNRSENKRETELIFRLASERG